MMHIPFQRNSNRKRKTKMGSSTVIQLSSMLMVLLLVLLNINGSLGIASTELQELCSTTQDPGLCVQALSSDPRTAAADLKGLAQISIDLAKANATDTATFVASLVGQTTDPELKLRYQSCATDFNSCIGSLDSCTKAVSSGDFSGLQSQSSASLDGPVSCRDSFQGPPDDPAHVSDKCQITERLISIISAIAKRLI